MHNQTNIKQLIKQCLNGEQSAHKEIYRCYYKAMYNTAFRILNDSFEAEDMMQESFLTAFSKLSTFKSESKYGKDFVPFGSWLKRIVVNKCLTQLKKNKKIELWSDNLKPIENIGEADQLENEEDYQKITAKQIVESINKLKQNYALVLNLSLIEGYDNEEIAQILNTNNQQVRTTISRAKKKLKEQLNQYIK
ncbi:MAG TPA: RNA polymerase sigma factor [Flavobacteriia bacterium]|nr:RNA polymerase sigma factor [Flavobacteriia bacterium]